MNANVNLLSLFVKIDFSGFSRNFLTRRYLNDLSSFNVVISIMWLWAFLPPQENLFSFNLMVTVMTPKDRICVNLQYRTEVALCFVLCDLHLNILNTSPKQFLVTTFCGNFFSHQRSNKAYVLFFHPQKFLELECLSIVATKPRVRTCTSSSRTLTN